MTDATYSISRDGLTDLALSYEITERLDNVLNDDDGWLIQDEIEAAVNAKLAEHGVTPDGEWLGDWSAEAVVRSVLAHHDDLIALGAERRTALVELNGRTQVLRAAVVRAMSKDDSNESQVSRDAGVDRMTIRKWVGK